MVEDLILVSQSLLLFRAFQHDYYYNYRNLYWESQSLLLFRAFQRGGGKAKQGGGERIVAIPSFIQGISTYPPNRGSIE